MRAMMGVAARRDGGVEVVQSTALAKALRWILGIGGLILLIGGPASCQAATTQETICVGPVTECIVAETPDWGLPVAIAGIGVGITMLLGALFVRSPAEERRDRELVDTHYAKVRAVVDAVRKRDGGVCHECGASDGTEVVYRTTTPPPPRDPRRFSSSEMWLACAVHAKGLPSVRGALGLPPGA